jgi:serine/threonine-protein kinase RsbW
MAGGRPGQAAAGPVAAGTRARKARPAGSGGRRRDQPTIELHIPSILGWERAAVDLAAGVAGRMGFPADRIEDIKTAVAEATTNAIEHGNALDAGQRVLVVLAPEGESLEIRVRDRSPAPFAPAPAGAAGAAAPDLEAKVAGQASARGWGMFLIKSLVDEVEFASTPRGNVVRMVIHLEPADPGEASSARSGRPRWR